MPVKQQKKGLRRRKGASRTRQAADKATADAKTNTGSCHPANIKANSRANAGATTNTKTNTSAAYRANAHKEANTGAAQTSITKVIFQRPQRVRPA